MSASAPHIHAKLWGLTVNLDTLLACWAVMLFIVVLSWLATRNLEKQKIGVSQFIAESIYDLWEGQIGSQISWKPHKFLPLIGGIFCFTVIGYWFGLLPWKLGLLYAHWPRLDNGHPWEGSSPSSDINITAGMAIVSVICYLLAGSAGGKFAYWAPYLGLEYHHGKIKSNPTGLIEWLDLLLRPFTLALRLFANTFAGEALLATLVKISPFIVPILALAFEFGVGILQAFIFAMLTTVYISIALAHAEEENLQTSEYNTNH